MFIIPKLRVYLQEKYQVNIRFIDVQPTEWGELRHGTKLYKLAKHEFFELVGLFQLKDQTDEAFEVTTTVYADRLSHLEKGIDKLVEEIGDDYTLIGAYIYGPTENIIEELDNE